MPTQSPYFCICRLGSLGTATLIHIDRKEGTGLLITSSRVLPDASACDGISATFFETELQSYWSPSVSAELATAIATTSAPNDAGTLSLLPQSPLRSPRRHYRHASPAAVALRPDLVFWRYPVFPSTAADASLPTLSPQAVVIVACELKYRGLVAAFDSLPTFMSPLGVDFDLQSDSKLTAEAVGFAGPFSPALGSSLTRISVSLPSIPSSCPSLSPTQSIVGAPVLSSFGPRSLAVGIYDCIGRNTTITSFSEVFVSSILHGTTLGPLLSFCPQDVMQRHLRLQMQRWTLLMSASSPKASSLLMSASSPKASSPLVSSPTSPPSARPKVIRLSPWSTVITAEEEEAFFSAHGVVINGALLCAVKTLLALPRHNPHKGHIESALQLLTLVLTGIPFDLMPRLLSHWSVLMSVFCAGAFVLGPLLAPSKSLFKLAEDVSARCRTGNKDVSHCTVCPGILPYPWHVRSSLAQISGLSESVLLDARVAVVRCLAAATTTPMGAAIYDATQVGALLGLHMKQIVVRGETASTDSAVETTSLPHSLSAGASPFVLHKEHRRLFEWCALASCSAAVTLQTMGSEDATSSFSKSSIVSTCSSIHHSLVPSKTGRRYYPMNEATLRAVRTALATTAIVLPTDCASESVLWIPSEILLRYLLLGSFHARTFVHNSVCDMQVRSPVPEPPIKPMVSAGFPPQVLESLSETVSAVLPVDMPDSISNVSSEELSVPEALWRYLVQQAETVHRSHKNSHIESNLEVTSAALRCAALSRATFLRCSGVAALCAWIYIHNRSERIVLSCIELLTYYAHTTICLDQLSATIGNFARHETDQIAESLQRAAKRFPSVYQVLMLCKDLFASVLKIQLPGILPLPPREGTRFGPLLKRVDDVNDLSTRRLVTVDVASALKSTLNVPSAQFEQKHASATPSKIAKPTYESRVAAAAPDEGATPTYESRVAAASATEEEDATPTYESRVVAAADDGGAPTYESRVAAAATEEEDATPTYESRVAAAAADDGGAPTYESRVAAAAATEEEDATPTYESRVAAAGAGDDIGFSSLSRPTSHDRPAKGHLSLYVDDAYDDVRVVGAFDFADPASPSPTSPALTPRKLTYLMVDTANRQAVRSEYSMTMKTPEATPGASEPFGDTSSPPESCHFSLSESRENLIFQAGQFIDTPKSQIQQAASVALEDPEINVSSLEYWMADQEKYTHYDPILSQPPSPGSIFPSSRPPTSRQVR